MDVDGEIGKYNETPIKTAHRELFEETGYKARNMELLFERKRRGTINQDVYYYLATDIYKSKAKRHIDETEPLKIVEMNFDKAIEMAYNLDFPNETTSLMIIGAARKLGKIK